MKKIKILMIGGGGRGTIYARHALHLRDRMEIVAIAEPRKFFRDRIGDMHDIPEKNRFSDWHEVVKLGKIADMAIITTQDRMHLEPALAFTALKYHIMIEKPLAPTAAECRLIRDEAKKAGIMMAVCHVLRYTNYTRTLKRIVESGGIGKITTIQHLEPAGYWRFAHSYVRGNWNRESDSSSVLLAKSIHDLDWIQFMIDRKCKSISSFGSLMFYKRENQPKGAADRCLDCAVESGCPYSAQRFYLRRLREGVIDSYMESLVSDPTEEKILDALKTSKYGRCVFACDNDVVDHQVVNMEFEGGATAVFTLAGCSHFGDRRTTIFGSLGEVHGTGDKISVFSYLTGETTGIKIPEYMEGDRHGGGDYNLLETFVNAIYTGDPSHIVSGPDISEDTHLMCFAAEKSRHENKTVIMSDFEKEI